VTNAYRDMLTEHLAAAEQRILDGGHHVARQTLFISDLERGGLDASWASRVLVSFVRAQSRSLLERDRLLALLTDR
jgi:hypothetical protein